MKIIIKIIPHSEQRYPTVGDWQWQGEDLHIKVSELGHWKFNVLVGFHEMIEALLCKDHGVSEQDVDQFDIFFESQRVEGNVSEPGDDMAAPYWHEHQMATGFERLMAASLGVNWPVYEEKVASL